MLNIAAFILSLVAPPSQSNIEAYYARTNPALGSVPHCLHGSMTLQDSGWLVGSNGHKVDFHTLMANPSINGVPDRIYNSLQAGQFIAVCQNGGRLQYSIR